MFAFYVELKFKNNNMKIGKLEYEMLVDSSKAVKNINKVNEAFQKTTKAMDKLNLALEKLQSIDINYCLVERKKKWYQFWKL